MTLQALMVRVPWSFRIAPPRLEKFGRVLIQCAAGKGQSLQGNGGSVLDGHDAAGGGFSAVPVDNNATDDVRGVDEEAGGAAGDLEMSAT